MTAPKRHHPHPTDPDRTRCGRLHAERLQIAADRDRVTCARCLQLEPTPASSEPHPSERERLGLLRYSLEASLADAEPWLRDADRATVALARHLADQLDQAVAEDQTAIARQLSALYRALGLSPDGRAQLEVPERRAATPLDDLRDGSVLRAVQP